MQARRTAAVVAALAALTAGSLAGFGSTPAGAAGPDQSSNTNQAGQQGKHCAVKLEAIERGEAPPADAKKPSQRCFDSFSESVSFATNGRIKLPADATPRSAAGKLGARRTALLGVLYAGADYGGASKAIYGGGRGCYAGRQYFLDDLGDIGFADRASSANLASNCLGIFYRHRYLNGDSFLCEGNCRGLGRLNNESSSIEFF